MHHLVQDGQRTIAVEHYQTHLDRLQREGLELSAELEALYQQIIRDELSAEIEQWDGQPVVVERHQLTIPNNLPSSLTPIIGREEELMQLQNRIEDPTCRLLTIIGLGGVGKTCLALEAARRLTKATSASELFSDGIYLIRLERIEPDQPLPSIIAGALNFAFQGTLAQTEQLFHFLHHRRILLILDNFEHLLAQSPLLQEMLEKAPNVKILVTTRERLDFLGEWLLPIRGLSYPSLHHRLPQEASAPDRVPPTEIAWQEYPAVQLFIHMAQTVQPAFEPIVEERPITQICETLEGLPLGLQLAAAAVYVHDCQEIADAIQRNLDFINTTMRNVTDRHRSLRAVFNHSWQLLTEKEQNAFTNLAVFVDGFTEEHAQIVAQIQPDSLVLLNRKSLVQQVEEYLLDPLQRSEKASTKPAYRKRRYRMHPVLHQYATQQLLTTADAGSTLRQQHCLYFSRFAAEQESALLSADVALAAAAVALEMENIRASWRYALTRRWGDLLRSILTTLIRFYLLRGFLQDAESLVETTIREVQRWLHTEASIQRDWQHLQAELFAFKAEVLTELGQYDAAIAAGQSAIESRKQLMIGKLRLWVIYTGVTPSTARAIIE